MTSKQEILDAEDKGWRALCERLDAIGEGAWHEPGAAGEWTPRDVLAHISCWQAQLTDWLEAWRARAEAPSQIDFDAFNARFHDECRDLSLHDTRVMSGASRHRMREELARLDENTMSDRWWRLIETVLHAHYDEHIPDLDEFLGRDR